MVTHPPGNPQFNYLLNTVRQALMAEIISRFNIVIIQEAVEGRRSLPVNFDIG